MNLLSILTFLSLWGCHPAAEIVSSDRTYYLDGVIHISVFSAEKFIHEAIHDCQFQKHGRAKTAEEWEAREREAHRIELAWRQRDV